MPQIRANRETVDDRFAVLGFTVRTESPMFEVGIATDPALFRTENRPRRSRRNFYSSRSIGALRSRRGEAVYLVPPDVLANFIGQPKLYFGLATYRENSGGVPDSVQAPTAGNMYVDLRGLTERGLRRLARRPAGDGAYGATNGHDPSLDWGGDAQPQSGEPAPAATNGPKEVAGRSDPPPATGAPYDDGYGPFLPPEIAAGSNKVDTSAAPAPAELAHRARALEAEDDNHGIDGPIPDDEARAEAEALRSRTFEGPVSEYPGASRFAPAHRSNYRAVDRPREVSQIVIHITDGGSRIAGTIGWFQNPDQRNSRGEPIHVSAHFVVGRDGEVVQMVRTNDVAWHANAANRNSVGIEHVANTRGLMPTEELYRGSAALVAWLCDRYGLPLDRTHVLGHAEADTRTSHTDCPNAVWDWEHYMDCVQEAAAALPTAQSLGRSGRKVYAKAQEIITPFYDQSDPMSALTCQRNAFSLAREEWFMGVGDTGQFPHSAICKLEVTDSDGNLWSGTGFYIDRTRILTCAHNLADDGRVRMTQVVVTPGSNGAGDAPFGSVTVPRSSWRIAPGYGGTGDWANDLAVIDNVPLAAPNGGWFRFLNATPSDRLPIVVCGYSAQSDAVPELTDAIDGEKQHLHGGYAASQTTPEVIEYPILTLKGASGSPVYHLGSNGGAPQALVCAVHVTGEPAALGLNRGCFITPGKIDWIEGRVTSFALRATPRQSHRQASRSAADLKRRAGGRARALIIGPEDVEQAQRYAPQWADLFNWIVPDWIPGYLAGRDMGVQRMADAVGALNLDRYEVRIATVPSGHTAASLLEHVRTHLNDFLDTDNSEFIPYEAGDDDVKWASASPVGTVFKIDVVGPDNAAVVASLVEEHRWRFTTVTTEWSGAHPVSGHREFGVRTEADGAVVVYTRGADRATDGLGESIVFFGADHLWRSFQGRLTDWVNANGGAASISDTFSERFHPAVVDILYGHGTVAQSLSAQSFSLHWDDTPYQPQSSESSCWAAAAAMVVGWRDRICIPDAEIAVYVPVIDAYRNGLPPSARTVLGDAWGLVAEPPASYTIEAFRQLLADFGPLYVGMNWDKQGGGHARVLVGMESGGAADGSDTTMFLYDPWPETPGRIRMPFNEFVALYEGRMTESGGVVDVQILHADGSEGRSPATAAPFSLSLSAGQVRAPGESRTARRSAPRPVGIMQRRGVRALATETIEYPVQLIPQPDKLACWAASMAMLLSFRRKASHAPEALAADVGESLMTSYGWELLQAVRDRYGFTAIEVPSNSSLYFSPSQWTAWLRDFGPLWVVIVGMPHAVVVSGLRGDTDDPRSCEVRILNPWDTRVAFDDDPVAFHPANAGYADWIPFELFSSDFGNMAEPDYGNWRVLHLPAQPGAAAQGLSTSRVGQWGRRSNGSHLAIPPRPIRALGLEVASALDEPIEPSRVPGTTMRRARGSSGRVTWALDQLDGLKLPDPAAAMLPALLPTMITLDQWPSVGRDAVPLPLTVRFDAGGGALGNVRISAGTPADLPYDVTVTATIKDEPQSLPGASAPQAMLRVTIDYDFSGMPDRASARVALRLAGSGRYDLDSAWQ
jgi:V8-like Glu-specific endopeptidase